MNRITRDFVSNEDRNFSIKIGSTLASALTGFVAGTVAALIVFLTLYSALMQ
jgi:hypothetical protein